MGPPSSNRIPGNEDLAALLRENAALRARAREAEGTLAALCRGSADVLFVGSAQYVRDGADLVTQQLYRQVLAHMGDAVLAVDNDEHIIFMNPAAERQYGRSLSEMLGRPRSELYRETPGAHVLGDGSHIDVSCISHPLQAADGRDAGQWTIIRPSGNWVAADGRPATGTDES